MYNKQIVHKHQVSLKICHGKVFRNLPQRGLIWRFCYSSGGKFAPQPQPQPRAPAPSSGPAALGSSSSTARGVGIIEAMARRVGPKNIFVLNDG